MRITTTLLALSFTLTAIAAITASASEQLTGIACRSVHLAYSIPESSEFYLEMKVEESAPGTYFMAAGFGGGYFGIQQLANDKRVVLFSVWEPGDQNDPSITPEDRRVKLVSQGEGVRVKRFGGEGTGGQSFYDYDWKNGETYRFLVRARHEGNRTIYVGYFYLPDEKRWQQMAEFSTLNEGQLIGGCYSFVEDFLRNRESTKQLRRAEFGNVWARSTKGEWQSIREARFTADGNKAVNIDAGPSDAGAGEQMFYLATGGDIENAGTPLREKMSLQPSEQKPPMDLPETTKPE
ncbi:DUF3472 domain-containing protein [Aeoliella sp. SH292]|uniref:DUF3472 domain-containing protein n=1 Tax=Aeoliella sp. SH292 TaxID=3454464 RepID=UPI003F98161D